VVVEALREGADAIRTVAGTMAVGADEMRECEAHAVVLDGLIAERERADG
jgi:hypothetical protein